MLGAERMRKTISRHGATALACVLAISVANEKVAHAEKTQRPEKKKTSLPRTDPRARARPKSSELILALPSGAAYSVDDGPSQLADTRTRVLVDPGEHRVHVMSGSRDVVVDVSIEQGASAVVRMPPAEASPPLVLARVMDAGVTDPAYGPPPLATDTSPAGDAAFGGIAPSTAMSVPPPPRIEVSPSLAPTTSFSPTRVDVVPHGKAPVVISLVGAAASLAALGTGFALASGGASSDATRCAPSRSTLGVIARARTAADDVPKRWRPTAAPTTSAAQRSACSPAPWRSPRARSSCTSRGPRARHR